MNKDQLKAAVLQNIEGNCDKLIEVGTYFYNNPETGFQEVKTAQRVKEVLEECGLSVRDNIAITGVKATAAGRKHDINLALMGELDALNMPSHIHCNSITGKFHGCGHHAQLTTFLGVALGLVKSGLMSELDGDLTFIGVPAEEIIEQDFRKELRNQGKIGFLSGKQEMIRLGEFDDVDMVMCSHVMGQNPESHSWVGHSWNGVIFKTVKFTGRGAHAGLAPHNGINALEAALCGMNNINALRESFLDSDHVRVHYIITKGGDSCNIVPDDIRMEVGVRAANMPALRAANEKVNKALHLGAEAIGAEIEIHDSGMDLPCHQNETMGKIYLENAKALLGEGRAENVFGDHRGSSTDCGDVASIIPLIHPYFGGAVGTPHANDFDIVDPYAAYVVPSKIAAMTAIDLLYDDAKLACEVKKEFVPAFANKEEYLEFARSLM